MVWSDVTSKLALLFGGVQDYVFDHPVEFDTAVALVVVGSCVYFYRRKRRLRSRAYRLIWGALMKRKDRERYLRMQFEDAIVDRAMEMVHRGDMSEREEAEFYELFATGYGFTGLMPLRNEAAKKRGIRMRLHMAFGLKPITIPGPKPGVTADPSYKPEDNVILLKGSQKSRYAA